MAKMAFLPFVTNSSSAESIFKSIVQRSKGSSRAAITNLLSVVLILGVDNARKKMEEYPSNLTTNAKIKELVASNPTFHPKKGVCSFWTFVFRMERNKNPEPHPIFTEDELEILFSVLASQKPEELKSSIFSSIDREKYAAYSDENFNVPANSIESVVFSESKSAIRVGFTSWEEFKAYLVYVQEEDVLVELSPVKIDKDATEVTKIDYENNYCSSPYV